MSLFVEYVIVILKGFRYFYSEIIICGSHKDM